MLTQSPVWSSVASLVSQDLPLDLAAAECSPPTAFVEIANVYVEDPGVPWVAYGLSPRFYLVCDTISREEAIG